MPRAKANEPLRSKTKPNAAEELTRGINTLRELSTQIDDLSRDGFPYREAVRARTELSFRETIRRLFGEKSPEYQTHKHHKLKVGSRAESAQSTALLKEFIAALEIQKAELLGLTPAEVIAIVRAETPRPSLISVPPTLPSDATAASPAASAAPLGAVSATRSSEPVALQTAPLNSSPAMLPSSSVPQAGSAPTPPATDTLPPLARDNPAPRPIQSPSSVGSAAPDAARLPQVAITQPPVTSAISPATPTPAETKTAGHAPIPATTIPPLAPTASAVPQGTLPPVPHTTLRPRPAPPVSIEPPATTQPDTTVSHAHAPKSVPIPAPPQPTTPLSAATTATSAPVALSDIRQAVSIVRTQTAAPPSISTTTAPQPELPLQTTAAQVIAPVTPSRPASPPAPVPEKAQATPTPVEQDTMEILRRVCARFHLVARQLRLRKEYRPTLEINDEYDLQDLFYALLRLQFDEVGTEDWSPPYAQGARRTSYLLDWDKTVVVVKQTRSGLSAKDLAEQVAADQAHYAARANGATLLCFIYDPDGRVGNPRGLEADLTCTDGAYRVEVIVAPK